MSQFKDNFFKRNNLVWLVVIILALIFVIQLWLFYNKSVVGYTLDYSKTSEFNNPYNVVYSMALDTIEPQLNDESDNKVTLFYDNTSEKYQGALLYIYSRLKLYPIDFPIQNKNGSYIYSMSKEKFVRVLKEESFDYIILLGKNVSMLNETSKYDFNLYRIENGAVKQLSFVDGFDLDLYSIYERYQASGKEEIFFKMADKIINTATEYWNFDSMNFIYDFANDAYENKDYNLAEKYYLLYTNKFNLFDATASFNLGKIYMEKNDRELARYYFGTCLKSVGCNIENTNKNIELLNK